MSLRRSTEIWLAYSRLLQAVTDKYRALLVQADPRLDRDMAFHLAHNWGNAASTDILQRFRAVYGAICARAGREYSRAAKEERK